jgi:hypothetical protein
MIENKKTLQDDQVDLNQIFKKLLRAKKTILGVTLLFVFLAGIIAQSRPSLTNSIALIEIGHYYDFNGKKAKLDTVDNLVDDLKLQFNYRKNMEIDIFARESNLIQAETTSSNSDGKLFLEELSNFIIEKHNQFYKNYRNNVEKLQKTKIENISARIDFYNKKIVYAELQDIQNEILDLDIKIKLRRHQIITLANEYYHELINATSPSIEKQKKNLININNSITLYQNIIAQEEAQLKLLENDEEFLQKRRLNIPNPEQVIYRLKIVLLNFENRKNSIESELMILQKTLEDAKILIKNPSVENFYSDERDKVVLFGLIQEKIALQNRLELLNKTIAEINSGIDNSDWNSKDHHELSTKIFALSLEKFNLESQLELFIRMQDRNVASNLIGEISSDEIYSKSLLIIFLGFIAGLVLSIFLVFAKSAINNILESK